MYGVGIVNLSYDRGCRTPETLLDRFVLLTGWAEAIACTGLRVVVFQRFYEDAVVERGGVVYQLVADGYPSHLRAWQLPHRLFHQIVQWQRLNQQQGVASLVHFNGLLFPLQAGLLRHRLPQNCPLVVQHHAEAPWPGLRRVVQRWGLRGVDGFLFTNHALAQAWLQAGVLASAITIHELMECSSSLRRTDQTAARTQTGMRGNPVLFWAGNLTANKDPLTILAGFATILADYPGARLYMAFRHRDLLPQVRECIAGSALLSERVHLLGEIPYGQIEPYYNSADLFVEGSAKEGSGVALLDALACGVIPVVSDIPAFRTITDHGAVGALWPVGDVAALATALRRVLAQPLAAQAAQVSELFQQRWSYPVIGRQAAAIYADLIQRHKHDR